MTATTKELAFHPVSEIFPMMDAAELAVLAEDIKANGQREPIWLYDGKVIDGRNRYEACKIAGVKPMFQTWNGTPEHLVAFVLSLNLHRRHLNESQRAMVAAKLATIRSGEHRDDNATQICVAQPEAAETLHVSTRSVQHARKVVERAAPEVVKAVEQGKVKVSDAAKVADDPKSEQRAALRAVMSGKAPTLAKAAAKREPQTADAVRRNGKTTIVQPTIDRKRMEKAFGELGRALNDQARACGVLVGEHGKTVGPAAESYKWALDAIKDAREAWEKFTTACKKAGD